MTTITSICALPTSPYEGTGLVGIVITSGVPSFFSIQGIGLDKIKSVRWLPRHPSSVLFEVRNIVLVDPTLGTFMIMVTDNYLSITDRGGSINITFDDDSTQSFPVSTYGPVSVGALWHAPQSGLNTS